MTIRIKGDKELLRTLERLPQMVRADVLEAAARDAIEPMEKDYRGGAPPTIARGVRTRVIEKKPTGVQIATGTKHPLAHIFEYGTKLRVRDSGGITGRIRAKAFGRPAFDKNVHGVFRRIGDSLWKAVSRAGR